MPRGIQKTNISVVLVRTLYDSNIGATSRAMANMGFHRLILINPACEISEAAHKAAATGQAALQNRTVYPDWQSFYASEPNSIRIALTARDGRGRAVEDLGETLKNISQSQFVTDLQNESDGSTDELNIHLIFGPEDWGLAHEDLNLVHYACSIPTYSENPSLNLAQAALLALFICRQILGGDRTVLMGEIRGTRTPVQEVFPEQSLKTWLQEMGFDLDKPKMNVYLAMKRILLHNIPTPKELAILETVLQQSIRKLREYNKLRKEKSERKN